MARIKGSQLLYAVKRLRADVEAARRALPPRLHRYLEERIMASTWYPEEDQLEILRAIAKTLPSMAESAYIFMGREGARQDFEGVYRSLLVRGNAAASFKRVQAWWSSYHDTGKLLVVVEQAGRVRIDRVGYEIFAPEMCEIQQGWLLELLRRAEDVEGEVAHPRCTTRGDLYCRFLVQWKTDAKAADTAAPHDGFGGE